MTTPLLEQARLIWDWLPEQDRTAPADMIFALGSVSLEVPLRVVELYKAGLAPVIMLSGGFGRLSGDNQRSEADIYADVIRVHAIDTANIHVERASTNTGENISFSKQYLAQHSIAVQSAIAVTTPLLSRRQKATLEKQWPEVAWCITTPAVKDFQESLDHNGEDFINLIAGEIFRLQTYPDKGFSVPVDIPQPVSAAYTALVDAGYTEYTS